MTPIWKEYLAKFYVVNLSIHMCIKIRRIPGEYRSNTSFCALLDCLAQHPFAFTSWCRTDKAGRGAPTTALERSDLAEKLQFRASHTEFETKKNS